MLDYTLTVRKEDGSDADIAYETSQSAGFDIKSTEAVIIPPGKVKMISTGLFVLKVALNEENKMYYRGDEVACHTHPMDTYSGWVQMNNNTQCIVAREYLTFVPEIQIRPRSGLAAKHSITVMNAPGTIDADYVNEIKVLLFNAGESNFEVKVGDKIAQGVVALVMRAPGVTVKDKVREGGFGSTGV